MTLLLALIASMGSVLYGQSTARIGGSITDASGGAVGGAKIVARNVATGVRSATVTNAEGLFEFPDLSVGTYEVTASTPGFQDAVRSGIELLTAHTVDLKITLQLAGVREQVQVTTQVPTIQTTTSQVQTTINSSEMRDLPLNGRNTFQLVVLTAGAATTSSGTISGQQDNTGISINGLRATDNDWRLDGVSYLNKHFYSAPTLPSPDTLQEFTVQSSNFSARESEGGSVIQASVHSGTNHLHGTVFDYLRNNVLDARNFFSANRPPFQRNQFGGTVGGPIVKDRTFFFASYQGTRSIGGASPSSATVPTTQEREGDLSAYSNVIIDPSTGSAFKGNVISDIDPLAEKVLTYVPKPNYGTNLYVATPRKTSKEDQFMLRVDHSLSAHDQLGGHYFYSNLRNLSGNISFLGASETNLYHNQSLAIFETHTFSPGFSLTTSFGYSRNFRVENPDTPTSLQDLGADIPVSVANAPRSLVLSVSGVFGMGTNGVYLAQEPRTQDFHATFFRSAGKHLLQFGTDIERDAEFATAIYNQSGVFTFDGSRTASASVANSGVAMADFLLGLPRVMTQVAESDQKPRQIEYALWIQDDWKINRKLTLNLGVRWQPWRPAIDGAGPLVGFSPGVQSTVAPNAPLGLVFSGDSGFQRSIFRNDWNNWAPRIGFAWTPTADQKTVVRGGFGLFYRDVVLNAQRYIGEGAPFRSLLAEVDDPPSLSNPWADTAGGSPYPFTPPSLSKLSTYEFSDPTSGRGFDPSMRTSYSEEWNLTVERQLSSNMAVSLAYVGNHSVGIPTENQENPGVYSAGATSANLQSRRPYQHFGSFEYVTNLGHGKYNGLQLEFTKRYSSGFTILANYAYSKSTDNNSAGAIMGLSIIDPFDVNAYSGPSDYDQTHRANVSFVYQLPRATSKPWLGKLLNDWHWNGIFSVQSGLPFTVKSGKDNSLSGVGSDNADQVLRNSRRPSGVDRLTEFFNTSAFAQNAAGTFGTAGRNSLRGPDSVDLDTSVFKDFTITERLKLQFRAEAFNFLNHAQFGTPNATVSSSSFGKVQSAGDPRVIQFALKLTF